MSENVPLVLCVAAIWVAWSVHDHLQEAIFLTPGFDFPLTMALTLQSSVISAAKLASRLERADLDGTKIDDFAAGAVSGNVSRGHRGRRRPSSG